MIVLARMALAIAPLMGAWAVVASAGALATSRTDLAASARRGLLAASGCAAVTIAALVVAFAQRDFGVRFVADNYSWHVPGAYAVSALLGAPGGALLAWAAVAGVAGVAAARAAFGRAAPDGRREARRQWVTLVVGADTTVALAVTAYGADPLAATTGAIADGAGLAPDLQRGAAAVHAALLLVGSAAALPAFAITIAALATSSLDSGWTAQVRAWNAVAWCALFGAAVAGARWFAMAPLRGSWLADPATAWWLLPVAIGAWLLHLDAGRSTPERVVMRTLLVTATLAAATGAMALQGGAFVRGGGAASAGQGGSWFAVVPAAAIGLMIARIRAGRGALSASRSIVAPPRQAWAAWIAHAGFILVAGAAIGAGFARANDVALPDAGIYRARDPFGHQWSFTSQGLSTLRRENFGSVTVSLLPARDGTRLAMLSAEARSYVTDDASVPGRVAYVRAALGGPFLETRLSIVDPDASPEVIRIAFVPLATWLVPGALLVVAGTLASLVAPVRPPGDVA